MTRSASLRPGSTPASPSMEPGQNAPASHPLPMHEDPARLPASRSASVFSVKIPRLQHSGPSAMRKREFLRNIDDGQSASAALEHEVTWPVSQQHMPLPYSVSTNGCPCYSSSFFHVEFVVEMPPQFFNVRFSWGSFRCS